jgi:hypothetical protein
MELFVATNAIANLLAADYESGAWEQNSCRRNGCNTFATFERKPLIIRQPKRFPKPKVAVVQDFA